MNDIPKHIVDELVRAAFWAGSAFRDVDEPVISGVVADGNTYYFEWDGVDL